MANNGDSDLKISHLFIAGAVTAAGAAFFWWIKNGMTRKAAPEPDDELDHYLIIAEADAVEGY